MVTHALSKAFPRVLSSLACFLREIIATRSRHQVPFDYVKTLLRALIISSDLYPPTRVDVTVLVGQELSARGHTFDLILQSEGACNKSFVAKWGGGRIWVGKTDLGNSLLSRMRKHVFGILHDLRLFGLLRGQQYDLIEVKDKFISGIFAAVAAKLYRKRFVFWLSWPYPEEYMTRARDGTARYPFLYLMRGHAFKFLLYGVLLPAADHVFVQSEQMRRDIHAEGIALEKMTAVPMGVDASRFEATLSDQQRVLFPPGEASILYLGTMLKVRRLDFLIRAFALVKARIANAKLYFVGKGDGPEDEQILIQEAARLNVSDSVILVGQLPQAQALRYVTEADVCVSPFYPTPILNSTSPTKLVEYMAMGKAVVANDHPEQRLQRLVLEQSGAGYCVPYEEEAFADAIIKLIEAPETARSMGARGRAYVFEHRTYPKIADEVERQLLQVLRPATADR
jgi:glycosyltransferase involved in cell wall biosynthesis